MAAIEKDRVLRINCPGFGHQSYMSTGCARPLMDYDVVIVNPISVLHLFDKDPELLKQIEASQSEGSTSFVAKSDKLIQSVVTDLDGRKEELAHFLEGGGLLVYFLCPAFTVQGPNEAMDNYTWLDILAPDKPTGKNDRHMSSASRGKNIELTEQGKLNPLSAYYRQAGLEWSTIIRAENLTDGYVPLALAGPNKCISAEFDVGENGGHIVFLPSPYLPDFDVGLMESVQAWYAERPDSALQRRQSRPTAADVLAPPPEPIPAMTLEPELREPAAPPPPPEPVAAEEPPPEQPAEPEEKPREEPVAEAESKREEAPEVAREEPEPVQPEPEVKPEVAKEEESAKVEEPPQAAEEPAQAAEEPAQAAEEPAQAAEEPAQAAEEPPQASEEPPPRGKRAAEPSSDRPAPPPSPAKAKDLMEKMEEISKAPIPEWCREYSFSDLDQLREQLFELNEQVRLTQMKIAEVEGRIETMEWLKNSLLSGEGDELMKACTKVLEHLGWTVRTADVNNNELYLMENGSTAAIARIVRTTTQVKRADLAQLAESIITYWGEHEEEPMGILVASTWANRPPSERTEVDYSDALAEFAQKKNLCLMTTQQLLCIFRDIEGGYSGADDLRDNILSTNGRLEGYELEPGLAASVS